MKQRHRNSGFTLIETLVGLALGALLLTVLLSMWLSTGRYSLMVEEKIALRDQASHIFSRLELDTKRTTSGGIAIAAPGGQNRMILQQFTGVGQDSILDWSPRAALYDFSPENKTLRRWESVVRDDSPPFSQPKPLTPEELLAFQADSGEFLRTWPTVENATFSKQNGLPTLVVELTLHREGPPKRGYRFQTKQGFSLLNGYEP